MSRAALFCLTYFVLVGNALSQSEKPITKFAYDGMGNLTYVSTSPDRATIYTYDLLGRKVREDIAGSNVLETKFTYDGLDQLVSVTDPRNLVTNYSVDGRGYRSQLSSPDTKKTDYSVDEAGNVLTMTDARGKTTRFQYDALNRMTLAQYQSGVSSQYEYDGGPSGSPTEIGNLTKIIDESGSTVFANDAMGRVIDKTQVVNAGGTTAKFVIKYEYGISGSSVAKLEAMTYPSGARINYLYNENGQLSSITLYKANDEGVSEVPLLTNIRFTPTGAPLSWNWGDSGLPVYKRTYDLDGRVTSYPIDLLGTVRSVNYNAANLITSYTHAGGPDPTQYDQTFSYDLANRLTSFSLGSVTTGFTYGATGNRLTQTGPNVTYTYSTTSNQLNSASFARPVSYSYDNAGNRTGDGRFVFVYNDRGRLAQVRGEAVLDFYYNALGQRILKAGARTNTYYVYDENGQTLGEYGNDKTSGVETVYLQGMPVAVIAGGRSFYVLTDHISTPLILGLPSGEVTWDWRNRDPFGNNKPLDSNFIANYSHRFPGQIEDVETGLFYNYYRDYDPQTGRYIESDPIGLSGESLNTYQYVNANPLSYADPNGLQAITANDVGTALPSLGSICIGTSGGACAAAAVGAVGVGTYLVTDRYVNPWLQPIIGKGVDWCMAQSISQSSSMHDPINRRARQHEAAKARCTPPNPPPDASCSAISKTIDMLKNSIDRYTYFDGAYGLGRHSVKIAEIENRIKNLKDRYDKDCTGCK